MRAFVVLGLVFSIPSQKTVLEKRLRNDLFCVESDVKPQLINQSINLTASGSTTPFTQTFNCRLFVESFVRKALGEGLVFIRTTRRQSLVSSCQSDT